MSPPPFSPSQCASQHIPVLLNEIIESIAPEDGKTYVDGTFGAGSYSRSILNAAKCTVWAIDRDKDAIKRSASLKKEFPQRFKFLLGKFGDMEQLLKENGAKEINGIALDLGVSSFQIDEAERGFSFQKDGPLDMRMGESSETAADALATLGETEIADILYKFGDERKSRPIARAIVRERAKTPITTTRQLAEIVRRIIPAKKGQIDPATRTFQAIRIYINDEMGELQRALESAENILAPGGKLAVVSFHSIEDRCVKHFLKNRSEHKGLSRYVPEAEEGHKTFKLLTRKAITPSQSEISQNPRSRSARLRVAERIFPSQSRTMP
ncbi:MAG: 16S rRNA (cytosine(1402)-N(4))-methyltransferase RsmH [Alphaproteobacteria bacterium]|mgnify:CR=1 FL=1|jgi:16S rRNA (cytosine1402-N4)-methyltransferase|nr:16S rRNA (cytosine(1402)-N(4))-methyltransferase RsmH [Alphaproteobacteria bacterium]MBT5390007.1 16S rRNA (cytosine(1402)-N(4))-methyltransferase RsmH [Alphaproteobacteria bacterium]MBT5540901.1 16S rRNA (cytosine(1402)-N(4))-methyltransferase RsmH [Alphaproteobacteria bacterium]MBT5654956.1 16S rRNA (cytosine(1402)-N(4))-methyltransferase RsmH [Alphaproteobacteria bacterium]